MLKSLDIASLRASLKVYVIPCFSLRHYPFVRPTIVCPPTALGLMRIYGKSIQK